MGRIRTLIALLLFSVASYAAETVTVNVKDITDSVPTIVKVRLILKNYGQNVPRTSSGVRVPPSKEFTPDGSGLVTMSVVPNDLITPNTTYYTVSYFERMQLLYSADYRFENGLGPYNLNTLAPITTYPVTTPPTGDTTYLRTDSGNTNLTSTHPFLFGNINNVRFASQFPGATAGEKIAAAIAGLGGAQGLVVAPSTLGLGAPTSIPNKAQLWDFRGADLLENRPVQFLAESRFDEVTAKALTGTLTFTNGSTTVTGVGTLFTSELGAGDFSARIKLSTDAPSAWAKIASITNDTSLTLVSNYTGAGGTGIGVASVTELPIAFRSVLTGGTVNSTQYGEVVGLSVFSNRTGGSRALFGLNTNVSYAAKSRLAYGIELDLTNNSGADWAEDGEIIDGEVNHSTGLVIMGVGNKNSRALSIENDFSSVAGFQRGISMDRSWYSKAIYSRARSASGVHLYLVPQADNTNLAIQLRNAADTANVFEIRNNGQVGIGMSPVGAFAITANEEIRVTRADYPKFSLNASANPADAKKWQIFVNATDGLLRFGALNDGETAESGWIEYARNGAVKALSFESVATTGTAPLTVASTTPVANLTTVPVTYNAAGTQQVGVHLVHGTATLSGGTVTVTLTNSAVFTSATSYTCTANDQTAAAAVKVAQNSGSNITFTGTGTDVVRYICIGN